MQHTDPADWQLRCRVLPPPKRGLARIQIEASRRVSRSFCLFPFGWNFPRQEWLWYTCCFDLLNWLKVSPEGTGFTICGAIDNDFTMFVDLVSAAIAKYRELPCCERDVFSGNHFLPGEQTIVWHDLVSLKLCLPGIEV